MPASRPRRLLVPILAGVVACAAAACAEETGSGASAGGPGVEYGSDREAFQEALADVDEITLNAQSPAPKGSVTTRKFDDYFAAVTEWSGGKIVFDIVYSNGVADPDEIDDALADGRLDVASANPIYEPQEYPTNAALNDISFLGDQSPVTGLLQAHGWSLEAADANDAIFEEFAEAGVHLTLPYYNGGSVGLFCNEGLTDLDDMSGRQSATSTSTQSRQTETLGMTPVSIAYTEVFESLQRGVVDCTTSSLQVAALSGFIPGAPQVFIDPAVGFGLSPGTIAFSQATWESLPLAAQQLLYDRLDVFLETSIRGVWENVALALEEVDAEGGAVSALPADVAEELAARNDELVDEVRGSEAATDPDGLVDAAETAVEAWEGVIEESVELEEAVTYATFGEWYADAELDLQPFIDQVFERALLDRRPQ